MALTVPGVPSDRSRGTAFTAVCSPATRPVDGGQHLPPLGGALRTLVVTTPLVAATAAPLLLAPAAALAPSTLTVLAPVVLAAAVLVGLPHGAVDLVQPDLGSGPMRRRALLGLAYLAATGAAIAAWWAWSLPTLLALLALSVVHFGTADDVISRWRTGATPSGLVRALRVLALGGLPVTVPFALHPAAVAPVVDRLAPGGLPVVRPVALVALVPIVAAAVATLIVALRSGDRVGALEPVLLGAMFATVSPLLAFAVYFGLWHSLRHVGRIVGADLGAGPGERGAAAVRPITAAAVTGALGRFARTALVPTLVAVAGLAVLVALGGTGALAGALVLVLALTVPHASVVAWQDSRLSIAPLLPAR